MIGYITYSVQMALRAETSLWRTISWDVPNVGAAPCWNPLQPPLFLRKWLILGSASLQFRGVDPVVSPLSHPTTCRTSGKAHVPCSFPANTMAGQKQRIPCLTWDLAATKERTGFKISSRNRRTSRWIFFPNINSQFCRELSANGLQQETSLLLWQRIWKGSESSTLPLLHKIHKRPGAAIFHLLLQAVDKPASSPNAR